MWLTGILAAAIAAVRRQRFILLLAAGAVAWVVVEVAFVLHGYPGSSALPVRAGGDRLRTGGCVRRAGAA